MTQSQMIWIAFGIVMTALLVGYYIYRIKHPVTEAHEKKRVGKRMRVWTKTHGFKQYDAPVLVHGGLSGWADHLVIGSFGVLLVYDLAMPGEYYGEPGDEKWTVDFDGSRYLLSNPRLAAAACTGRVRTLFRDAGVRMDVYTVLVMTGANRSTTNYIKSDELVKIGNLGAFLGRSRFEEEKGHDLQKLAAILEPALKRTENADGK